MVQFSGSTILRDDPAVERSHAHAHHRRTHSSSWPPTPRPSSKAAPRDIDQALGIFWNLVERLRDAADEQQPIHQVEEIIFRDVLTIGLAMLRAFLAASGDGDVGPTLTIPGETPDEPPQVLPRLDAPRSRPYLSDLRRSHHRAGRLRSRPARRRTAGRPAASAPAAVLLPAPASGWGPSSSTTPMPRPSGNSG